MIDDYWWDKLSGFEKHFCCGKTGQTAREQAEARERGNHSVGMPHTFPFISCCSLVCWKRGGWKMSSFQAWPPLVEHERYIIYLPDCIWDICIFPALYHFPLVLSDVRFIIQVKGKKLVCSRCLSSISYKLLFLFLKSSWILIAFLLFYKYILYDYSLQNLSIVTVQKKNIQKQLIIHSVWHSFSCLPIVPWDWRPDTLMKSVCAAASFFYFLKASAL